MFKIVCRIICDFVGIIHVQALPVKTSRPVTRRDNEVIRIVVQTTIKTGFYRPPFFTDCPKHFRCSE